MVWMVSARDGHAHTVNNIELDAGLVRGNFRPICGHDVIVMACVLVRK